VTETSENIGKQPQANPLTV